MITQHQASGWKCVGYALMLVVCGVGFAALALGESLGFFPTMILLAIVGVFSLVLCFQHYVASTARNDARRLAADRTTGRRVWTMKELHRRPSAAEESEDDLRWLR